MRVTVHIVHAFVDNNEGGNPAGVVLEGERFSTPQKQLIAAQVGLSETAFISPSTAAAFKLEFFTPTQQIAHCGHATVASFSFLRQRGLVADGESSKETIDGTRRVIVSPNGAFMEQRAPQYTDEDAGAFDTGEVLRSLGLTPAALLVPPAIVHTGNAFLLLALQERELLSEIAPDFAAIDGISRLCDLVGFYVFSRQAVVPGRDATARMFAPRYGILEEAGTGMAAGPLACFLYDRLNLPKSEFVLEQGHFMTPPSPSKITVRLELNGTAITGLMAGGDARSMRTIELEVA